jgi:hypothetical protein
LGYQACKELSGNQTQEHWRTANLVFEIRNFPSFIVLLALVILASCSPFNATTVTARGDPPCICMKSSTWCGGRNQTEVAQQLAGYCDMNTLYMCQGHVDPAQSSHYKAYYDPTAPKNFPEGKCIKAPRYSSQDTCGSYDLL